jgi:predicted secreted Zn-dependent protease
VRGACSLVAAAALLAAGCSPDASAGGPPPPPPVFSPQAEYRYYPVTGGDVAGIGRSMVAMAPRENGEPARGLTHWWVTWHANWAPAGHCRVTDVDVQLRAEVTLPSWTPPADADAVVRRRWERFLSALSVHEAGHVDIGTAAAAEISRTLQQVTAPDCGFMERRTHALVDGLLNDYIARDRSYDRQTRHGATQGAVWPPP